MSEEQTSTTEQNIAQTGSDTQATQTSTQTSTDTQTENNTQVADQGVGYERVDFTPEQQKRFDRLYGQVKAQDRKFTEAMDVMRQQSDVIAQLQNGVGQVVTHLNNQDVNASEVAARDEADAAFKRGDSRAYLSAMEKVAQISAQKIVNQSLLKQRPQQQQQRQVSAPNSTTEAANRAVQQGALSAQDAEAFEAWQEEKDQTGNYLRPWAKRETAGETFDSVLMRSAGVFADPKYRNAPIEQKLAEVDRIMNMQRQTPQQNVMGANLTAKGKTNTVKVSADMERVLNHLRPRGSKAKDAPDPIAWYREQANKAKQQGARR